MNTRKTTKTSKQATRAKKTSKPRTSNDKPIGYVPTDATMQGFVGAEDARFLRALGTATTMHGAMATMKAELLSAETYDLAEMRSHINGLQKYGDPDCDYSLNDLDSVRQRAWWLVVRATRGLMWRDGAERCVGHADDRPRWDANGNYIRPEDRPINNMHRGTA